MGVAVNPTRGTTGEADPTGPTGKEFTRLIYDDNEDDGDSHEAAIARLVASMHRPRARRETETATRRIHEHMPELVDDLLRHTGLLVQHEDGLDFPHQTFLEYHAARHATRNERARTELLDTLFPRDSWLQR